MHYRRLGQTRAKVSEIGFGGAGAIHLDFVAAHSDKWERVVVYDIETGSPM